MTVIRHAPPAFVECPACNGTGVKIEKDDRGQIPEPEKALGSLYVDNPTVCKWCAGSGRILNRKAAAFDDALRTLNAHRMLVAPDPS